MTGSALFDFLIAIVVLVGAVTLFMIAIDGISRNALLTKIAKFAVGIAALVAFLFAVKGVLFGGGGAVAVSPTGIIYFAIGIIVVLVVMYLANLLLPYIAPAAWVEPILFVIAALVLIALLGLAASTLFGGGLVLSGATPSRPFLR